MAGLIFITQFFVLGINLSALAKYGTLIFHICTQIEFKKIPGVGKVTLQKLHDLGLYIGQDVVDCPLDILHHNFGQMADVICCCAQGIDERFSCPAGQRFSAWARQASEAFRVKPGDC